MLVVVDFSLARRAAALKHLRPRLHDEQFTVFRDRAFDILRRPEQIFNLHAALGNRAQHLVPEIFVVRNRFVRIIDGF